MYTFKFADIGEGLHEGVVAEIYKKVGDKVKEGEPLFSVETDKITSDIPSPKTGTISKIFMNEGDTIYVGNEIYQIDLGNERTTEQPLTESKPTVKSVQSKPTEEKAASVVGEIEQSDRLFSFDNNFSTKASAKQSGEVLSPRMAHIKNRLGQLPTKPSLTPEKPITLSETNQSEHQPKFSATSMAKIRAEKNNVSLKDVTGTGPSGRIMKTDVEKFSENLKNKLIVPTDSKVEASPSPTITRQKVSGIRKTIAKVMRQSWSSVAYTNLTTEIEMTKLWDFRTQIKERIINQYGVKLTFLPFIVKAVALALKDFPNFNASYDEVKGELIIKHEYNLGIAVDTPSGLMVPVVKNANQISIIEIAKEITRLAKLSRTNKLKSSDMSQGTFSISNYGSVGSLFGVPVINYPEMAIVGIGTITDKVFVKNKQFVAGKAMYLTVAADHRWVDGADIGRFANRIKELLEEPSLLWLVV